MDERKERLSEKAARKSPLLINAKRNEVLLALHSVRFALTRHLVALLDQQPSNASRLLGRLYRHRYVDRMPQLVRHGPGAPALVYTLDILGNEYIAELHGTPAEDRPRAGQPVSTYFLEHYLAIADVYVALQIAARVAGLCLTWYNEIEAVLPYVQGIEERKLSPDALFWLAGSQILTTLVFLEVDRSTESLQRWQGKLETYQGYFVSPTGFQRQFRERPARVLVLVTARSEGRVQSLLRHTREAWQGNWERQSFRLGVAVHDHGQLSPERILTLDWKGLDQRPFKLVE
ncbi:MAG: replication-relaxation family protein [Anaerolineae bacterium]|nr:replication-relaxation family protein [Anaerolineae bacterium]